MWSFVYVFLSLQKIKAILLIIMRNLIAILTLVMLCGFLACDESDPDEEMYGLYYNQTDFPIFIQDSNGNNLMNDIAVKDIHVPKATNPLEINCSMQDSCFYVNYANLTYTYIGGTFSYENETYVDMKEAVAEIDIEWTNGDIDHVKTTHLSSGAMCLILKVWINGELVHDKTSPTLNEKIVLVKEP